MNKPLICSTLVLMFIQFGFLTNAQNNTSNPYSMYGMGELRPQTNAANAAMGNAGFALPTGQYLNLLNAASYTGLDSLNVLLEVGMDAKFSNFKELSESNRGSSANFSYLALGWRINRQIVVGFGLNPYSHTGYEINTDAEIEGETSGTYPLTINGSGNISRVYANIAVTVAKNLSVGFKPSFLFGSIQQIQTHDLSSVLGTGNYVNTTKDYYHNFFFEFGVQYTVNMKRGNLSFGAIYIPEMTMVTDRTNTAWESSWGTSEEENKDNFIIPQEFGGGIAFVNAKWKYALDAGVQKWNDHEYYEVAGVRLQDNPYVRTGLEFTPSRDFMAPYYKKVNYRMGFQYAKSYLLLRNTDQHEYCFSFGFGLPVRQQNSRFDLGFEIGKSGTNENRLIQENYFRIRLGFSLRDIWFQHRIYN